MPVYIIRTQTYGDIRKIEESIKAARAWAAKAFPRGELVNVSREYKNSYCDSCECAPCCCMVRRDA